MRFFYVFLVLSCFPLFSSATTSFERAQDDIIGREEQRRRDYILDLQRESPPQIKKQDRQGMAKQDAPLHEKLFNFSEIDLQGVSVFSQSRLKKIVAPFLNKDIALQDIDHLIRAITNLYIDAGYITSRVYLPEQHLNSGILHLIVVESRQGDLKILERGEGRTGYNTVFPDHNKLFNLRDYEQGLDQVNRLNSYDAKIDLLPGRDDGVSDVMILTDVKPRRTTLRFETNNGGSHATGRHQNIFSIQGDDYLRLYDSMGLTLRHDMGLNPSGKRNRGLSGNIEIPYDYWTFRFVGDYYKYLQTVRSNFQPFYLTGDSHSYMGEIERILHRDKMSKTGAAISVMQKTSKNYINGVRILTNSRKLTIGSGRVFHARRMLGGAFNISGQLDHGLKSFGAQSDKTSPSGTPKAQFKTIKLDTGYYKPFNLFDQNFAWQISAHGMWSKDLLFSSEKQSIGGRHSVRGYWDQNLNGNVGGYIQNELSWQLPFVEGAKLAALIDKAELYAAFDSGWIRDNASSKDDHGHLSGLGAGARIRGKHLFGEVGFEKALSHPQTIEKPEKRVFLKFGMTL